MQLGNQTLDIFQAEFDPEALKAVEPGEGFFVRSRRFPPWRDHVHDTEEK
jgi:hypothetical protein